MCNICEPALILGGKGHTMVYDGVPVPEWFFKNWNVVIYSVVLVLVVQQSDAVLYIYSSLDSFPLSVIKYCV